MAAVSVNGDESNGRAPVRWRDGKRYLWLLGLIVPLLPLSAYRNVNLTGSEWFWWSGPVVVFGLIPLLDLVMGRDRTNPPEEAVKSLDSDRYYRVLTYLYVPLMFGGLIWASNMWANGGLSLFAKVGLAVTVGTVSGIGINAAHELGHKRPNIERWMSKIGLAPSAYGHFYVEHNRGHHARVSTPEDPASSRLGENFYEFLPRTVIGSVVSAVEIEKERSKRLGRSFWSIKNDVLHSWAMTVVLFGGLMAIFGIGIAPYLLIQAVIGFGLLEVVNYLEHYGLLRAKRDDGRYVRCAPEHSWNSNNTVTNLFLFHLQRHSDHHANPTRRYQSLRHFDDVPQLPTGYAGMIVLAMVPPLWRRVMDKRVVEHYDGDLSKANVHPRTRDRLISRHGDGAAQSAAA